MQSVENHVVFASPVAREMMADLHCAQGENLARLEHQQSLLMLALDCALEISLVSQKNRLPEEKSRFAPLCLTRPKADHFSTGGKKPPVVF